MTCMRALQIYVYCVRCGYSIRSAITLSTKPAAGSFTSHGSDEDLVPYLNSIRRLLFHRVHTKVELLLSFIKLLEEKKLLDFSKFDFDMGLKIQKYVYLSRRYGLNWDYNFDLYIYGPYSSDLAEDYYDLYDAPKSATGSIPDSFMENEFMELVDGKTYRWLEIAAILLDLEEKFTDSEELVNHVESIELGFTVDYIRSVLHDLAKLRVLA